MLEDPKSSEIIKPYLRGRDIKRWRVDWQNMYLIYTYHGIDIEHYPAIYNYLLPYQNKLLQRATSHCHQWYELQQPQYTYSLELDNPKIIWQEIATYPLFAFSDSELFTNNKCYFMPTEEKWLLGLLNSKVVWWLLGHLVGKMQGGALSLQTMHMQQLPIPTGKTNLKDELSEKVVAIMNADSPLQAENEIKLIN